MAAYAKRQKTRPNYDPYAHENTHVFLPDGSEHLVKKTGVGRTSDEYAAELRVLIDPWEKDAILEQAEEQKTPEWAKYVMPNAKPLDKGGLRAARSNVEPGKVKNWDTFEISFDRADVATEDRQQAIFDEVVSWAKEIHTEGLEGGRRAFTIQDWHGLDGSSSRPHLRLEIHRIGWEPTPKLVPANGDRQVLEGTVQKRQNYAQESGETDKDFQPLVAALREKFGIHLQVGAPSLERDSDGRQAALAVPATPDQTLGEADRLLGQVQAPTRPAAVEGNEQAQPSGTVTTADKPFELRKPVDPFKDALAASLEKLENAKREADLLRAAHLTYAANEQLQDQVKAQGLQITDLQTQVARRDEALAQKDQALEQAGAQVVELTETVAWLEAGVAEAKVALEGAAEQMLELNETIETQRAEHAQEVGQLNQKVAQVEQALDASQKEAAMAKVERDALETRVGELAGRNSELVGENKALGARLEKSESELKLAREELAPLVAENAELKTERDRLQSENQTLAQQIKEEQLRRATLLQMGNLDNDTLAAKIEESSQLFNKLQEMIGNNPEALAVLEKVSSIITPRENYKSRVDAYVEAGMPADKTSEASKAFQEEVSRIHRNDGRFGQVAIQVHKETEAAKKEAATGAPKTVVQGPRPNPNTVTGPNRPNPGGSGDRGR